MKNDDYILDSSRMICMRDVNGNYKDGSTRNDALCVHARAGGSVCNGDFWHCMSAYKYEQPPCRKKKRLVAVSNISPVIKSFRTSATKNLHLSARRFRAKKRTSELSIICQTWVLSFCPSRHLCIDDGRFVARTLSKERKFLALLTSCRISHRGTTGATPVNWQGGGSASQTSKSTWLSIPLYLTPLSLLLQATTSHASTHLDAPLASGLTLCDHTSRTN